MTSRALYLTGLLLMALGAAAYGQPACPTAELRAYAHNDYNNWHPLHDASALGYRGVEADVFLIDGVLRVAHDRKAARNAPSLDILYLQPIREMFARCRAEAGNARASRPSFLLNIEVKEHSPQALHAVHSALSNYAELLALPPLAPSIPRLSVMLVGYSGTDSVYIADTLIGVACKLERISSAPACLNDSRVRMLSVDYGKTLGRWWTLDTQRQRWLSMLQATKAATPSMLIRVYNVPANAAVYAELLQSGVDLIGTKTLLKTQRLLAPRPR